MDREELISKILDGDLSEEDARSLEEKFSRDDALFRQDLDQARLLKLAMGEGLRQQEQDPGPPLTNRIMNALPQRPRARSFWSTFTRPVGTPRWALAAMAGAILLLLGLHFWPRAQGDLPSSPAGHQQTAPGSRQGPLMVRFYLQAPGAHTVSLVGDFNDWSTNDITLVDDDGDGIWTALVPLDPGRHRYKFLVDGTRWVADPNATSFQLDGFGGRNALLHL